MELLSARQRVVVASLLKRRPPLIPGTQMVLGDETYRVWYDLVCDEIQRLAIVDPSQIQVFCERAGVPADVVAPLSAVQSTAA
jgi:hypothetical protein